MSRRTLIDLLCGIVILVSFGGTWLVYDQLPDPVPSHYNLQGEADGWMPKPWGALLGAFVTLGIYLVFWLMPRISPRNFKVDSFMGVLDLFKLASVLVAGFVTCMTLSWALGLSVVPKQALVALLGVFLVVLGNYLSKVSKNFFIGIRTPWSLASDEVWERTHRLGGWLFVAAGILLMVGSITNLSAGLIVAVVAAAAIVPAAYSFIIYKRLEGF